MADDFVDVHMLANFIHQVINPLNGVIGTLDNVIDGTVEPGRRDQRLKAVRAQLEHSIELIRNLAYLSQLSVTEGSGALAARKRLCVIPQILIEAALFYQEPGLSRGVRIHLTDRDTQYAITGHPDLLRQVFMNLFENGVKYADRNTDFTVRPRVRRRDGGNELLLEFESRGEGFEPREAERIFELGYRGEAARARVASGTGLGLHICRRIVEDVHGGRIWAEHEPGARRTVFRVAFPTFHIERQRLDELHER